MTTPDIRRTAQHTVLYGQERQEALDTALTEKLGEYRWDLDLLQRRIVFAADDREVVGRADLLASVAAQPATLLWGWSPQLADHVGDDPAAQRLHDHGARHDLPSLRAEEVEYEVAEEQDQGEVIAELAHDVGRIGLEVFGSEALYYTFPIGGGSRGCVLVRDLDVELPPVRIEAIATVLGRTAGQIEDIGWAFDGLAGMLPGWTAEARTDEDGTAVEVLTDADGRRLEARPTRDEHGRLTELEVGIEGVSRAASGPAEPSPAAPAPGDSSDSRGTGLGARIRRLFGG